MRGTPLCMICPLDHSILVESATELLCHSCGRKFPIKSGVVRTLDNTDKFYEGAYRNQVKLLPRSERLWHAWPLWLINSGYLWTVRRHVPPGATVAELGSASGVGYSASVTAW